VKRVGHQRGAFTLMELMIVIAIVGLLGGQAVAGYAAWKRSTALQEAVSLALTAARRASSESLTFGRPYLLRYDAARNTLSGFRCEQVSAGADETRYVEDLVQTLPEEVRLATSGGSAQWLLDAGGAFLEPSGALAEQQRMEFVLVCGTGGGELVRFVRLEAGGRLRVATRREGP
jgi:prepilin-type N-terminal cleavage/methylation domain-containing protein